MPGEQGVAGNPIPYSIRGDDVMILTLLVGFCVVVALVGYYRKFLRNQFKYFFYERLVDRSEGKTKEERFMLLTLQLCTCSLLAYAACFFADGRGIAVLPGKSHVLVMVSFTSIFAAYFLLKWGLYMLVNQIFFDSKKTLQWSEAFQLLIAFEGLLLMPVIVLQVFSGLPWEFSLFSTIFVLILNKILTFYKTYSIFFHTNNGLVQFFLYLCALEIVPMLAFLGILQMGFGYSEIKF